MLHTVFLDAGGVLLFPNWTRIQAALAAQGVQVTADQIARAEPRARKQLDDQRTIGTTTDAGRGWLFFDLILEHAGVQRSTQTAAALGELHAYHQANNLWELVPDSVRPALTALRAHGLTLVVVSNATARCAPTWIESGSRPTSISSSIHRTRASRSRIPGCSRSRSSAPAPSPESTIHVGDLYQVDVVGARAAGVRGVLLDETGLYPDADCDRVASLAELVERVRSGAFD